jgi:hypothetical protein
MYIEEIRNQALLKDLLQFIIVALTGSMVFFFVYVIQKGFPGHEIPDAWGFLILMGMVVFTFVYSALFFLLVISLAEHFFVLFISDKPDFEKTMKSVIYASMVPILFIWIPAIFHIPVSALALTGVFIVFTFYGILIFHNSTKDRAAFVAIFLMGVIISGLCLGRVI